ncbi:3-methyl-2-oxobutanoate hydroxymethyltransferase [Emcibacter sp.]|uniref:3-methyl-2-oxobutanoate hydroxymethyltransferase n=1 Tax=Emcibacter sp. TaxID=1979954 RepID=UPI003A905332
MYADHKARRKTVRDIAKLKGERPIVSLTAYTAPMANWLDDHVDFLLVGDSLDMVLYGFESTTGMTLDIMIEHTKAVMRGSQKAMVIIDLPFGTYEESPEVAFHNAAQAVKNSGCAAVKLEGGVEMAETIRYLTDRKVAVLAHIGLKPQAVNVMGGYVAQGRTEDSWGPILEDARAVQEAGAFAVVLEGVTEPLAQKITEELDIPTIGIGAGKYCDGQILVTEDMLGLFPGNPKFVKRYAEMGKMIDEAIQQYAEEVKSRAFPGTEHTYAMKTEK